MTALSRQQTVLLQTYEGGEYAFLIDQDECGDILDWNEDELNEEIDDYLETAGDTTILAMFRDLATDGDTDHYDYVKRLTRSAEQIEEVIGALIADHEGEDNGV